jgi:RNA polymerase sigma-70 factor (ECF subfamily)
MSQLSVVAGAPGHPGQDLGGLLARFERAILPHRDAAYDLARWLTRRAQDAEDVVQEACLRAFQFFGGFHGGDGRAWLLGIVRNTCYTWLRKNRVQEPKTTFDLESHDVASTADDPEEVLLQTEDVQLLRDAVAQLPAEFREVIELHDLQGLLYRQVADRAGIPLGTVMSRLARGRQRLGQLLVARAGGTLA